MKPYLQFRSFLFLLLIIPNKSIGQKVNQTFKKDSILAHQFFEKSEAAYMNVDECLKYTNLAIPLFKKTKQWEKYVYCLAVLSYCYDLKENYDSLISNNIRAVEEAEKHLPKNELIYIYTLNNLGYAYAHVFQDYKTAISMYKKSLEIVTSENYSTEEEDDVLNTKGVVVKNLGDVYLSQGDYNLSVVYFKQALEYYKNLKTFHGDSGPNFRVPEAYKSIANTYQYAGNYLKAIEYLQNSLIYMDNSKQPFVKRNYVYSYTQLAELSGKIGAWKAAFSFLKKATNINDLSQPQKIEIARLFSIYFLNKNNFKRAEKHIDEAINLNASSSVNSSKLYTLKGEILTKQNQFTAAQNEYSKAFKILLPNLKPDFNLSNFNPNQKILSHLDLINLLTKSAEAYQGLHRQENDLNHFKKALNSYNIIATLSEKVRNDYLSEESKIFLNQNIYSAYESAIEAAYLIYKETEEQTYIEQAFTFLEKSKASVLLEEINSKEAVGISNLPKELVDEKYRLRTEINICKKKLEEQSNKEKPKTELIKILNSRLFELSQAQAQLKEKIETAYPEYSELTKGKVPSIADIQNKLLSDKTAIVEYFIGAENGYAIFISKDKREFVKISPKEIEKDVKSVMANLKLNQGIKEFTQPANRLFENTLGIFDLSDIEELLIIPDGALSNIPFEILLTQLPKTENPKEFNYLIKSKAVSYAYSVSLFELQKKSDQSEGNALIIAPLFKNDPSKKLEFGKADIEVFAGLKHEILKGEEATLANFLTQVENFDLIYLSTHADANSEQPYIEFIDSLLYLNDLYAMNLSSHLVVLSACQTGVGDEQKGEGVMSLARGFTYAGVPSTVATLWKVNEKSTNSLMQNFYGFLTNGLSKSQALRASKLEYLRDCSDVKSSPYYWGSLVVIGDNQPFHFTRNYNWKNIIVGLFCLFGVFWFYKKYSPFKTS